MPLRSCRLTPLIDSRSNQSWRVSSSLATSASSNIKAVRTLAEPLQVEMDNGTRRALVPLDNNRNFLEVSADIVERVAPAFISDPTTAAMKTLEMTEYIFTPEFPRHL